VTEIRVHMRHVRKAGLCSRGLRAWAAANGFQVAPFLSEGLPVETVEATGDGFALKVAKIAREEAAQ
jgi:hypothetical protein